MCWNVDAQTLQGACIPFCVGSPDDLSCEDPARVCSSTSEGILALCRPRCSPLDVESCLGRNSCVEADDGFVCLPVRSADAGAAFEPCEFLNACNPGLGCTADELVGACPPGSDRCCTPWCDLEAPDCPSPTTCQPYESPNAPTPGNESLGYCGGA